MGFVQDSIVIADGANVAIAGVKPSGIAAQGKVIWQAITSTPVLQINCGGAALAGTSWIADSYFTGGNPYSTTNPIDTSKVTNPAPQQVYQTQRNWAANSTFTYTLPNLTANTTYRLRLHFAEIATGTGPGIRVFNVSVNGASVISNLDLVGTVGALTAYIFDAPLPANASGQFVISVSGGYPALNGIEVLTSPQPQWQLLASTLFTLGTSATSGTSAPINTTGTKLIVVMNSIYTPVAVTLTDNQNNTWTQIPYVVARANFQAWYCIAPATATAHTFSFSSGNYSNAIIMAFSCTKNVAFDQITTAVNNTSNATSIQLPAIMPSAANCLLISGIANSFSINSVDSSFIIAQNGAASGGQNFGVAGAYLIQSTAASVAPTWQVAGSVGYTGPAAALLSFKPS